MKGLGTLLLIAALVLFVFAAATADGASLGMSATFWTDAGLIALVAAALADRAP